MNPLEPGKAASEITTLVGRGASTAADSAAGALALTILYHPDLERIGDRAPLDGDGPWLVSRTDPDFAPPGRSGGAPLDDGHLSRSPLRLASAGDGGVRLELGESKTSVAVRGRPVRVYGQFSAAQVKRGVVLELGHRVVLLLHHVASLEGVLDGELLPGEPRALVGESDAIRRVLWDIRSVADLDLPVLLRGETGSGKELVAHAVHRASARRDRPFVPVNLGAITPSLALAELFGAEKGAFTGSVGRRLGYFEQARGGTLFLDEIGEAPPELQVALLRALETGEIQTVGAQEPRKADVRILAATDADLEAKVASGAFRAPLLNRLSSYEIWIPPLRDRRDDIGRLLVRFLREEIERVGEAHRLAAPGPNDKPWLPPSLVAQLAEHDWPGNVRQLRNVVRQLVVSNRGRDRVELSPAVERLLAEPGASGSTSEGARGSGAAVERSLAGPSAPDRGPPAAHAAMIPEAAPAAVEPPASPEEHEEVGLNGTSRRKPSDVTEDELAGALRACRWDLAAAANRLGISRASIYLLIERGGRFRTARDLKPEEIIRCHRECSGDLGRMVDRLEISERALLRRLRELGLM